MKSIIAAFGIVLLAVTLSFGDTINFNDSTIHWTGYASSQLLDNGRDTIGQPDFTGGSVVMSNGRLQSITFNYIAGGSNLVLPEDLFLFTGTGNYAVRLGNVNSGGYGLYTFDPGEGYNMSDATWTAPGYDIRDNHPVRANLLHDQVDGIWFTGWDNTFGTHQATFLFNDFAVGNNFELAWTVNCANDVIRENINASVPEPATMLLLGIGLISLAGMKRRMHK